MSTVLYAQPYDISAEGFYFHTVEEFTTRIATLENDCGDPVEEFEIQFIDGESIDCELAKAIGICQANFSRFFEIVDEWEIHEKLNVIIAVGECGYDFELNSNPNDFDVDIYEENSLCELAERFIDEGLLGDIPDNLQFYIDYDAIARDLAVEYSETTIAGSRYVYVCR